LRILIGRKPKRTLVRIGVLIVASFVTFKFILLPIRMEGISMKPTYQNGRFNLVNTWAYRWTKPRRGDVVSITFTGRSAMLLKRIIGLPGERVAIRQGIVSINGNPLDEPYLKEFRAPWNRQEVQLRLDEFFVIGDNRSMPARFHEFGEVTRRRIVGKVVF
jgi:signal peptidase I